MRNWPKNTPSYFGLLTLFLEDIYMLVRCDQGLTHKYPEGG